MILAPNASIIFLRSRLTFDGHHELDRIAERRADHRQRDPGVARGRIDDRLAGPQLAAFEPDLDHVARGAVLDRAAGVEALELGEDPHAGRNQPRGQRA